MGNCQRLIKMLIAKVATAPRTFLPKKAFPCVPRCLPGVIESESFSPEQPSTGQTRRGAFRGLWISRHIFPPKTTRSLCRKLARISCRFFFQPFFPSKSTTPTIPRQFRKLVSQWFLWVLDLGLHFYADQNMTCKLTVFVLGTSSNIIKATGLEKVLCRTDMILLLSRTDMMLFPRQRADV